VSGDQRDLRGELPDRVATDMPSQLSLGPTEICRGHLLFNYHESIGMNTVTNTDITEACGMVDGHRAPTNSSNSIVRDAIVGLIRGRDHVVVTECRRCGTSVDTGTRACPAC